MLWQRLIVTAFGLTLLSCASVPNVELCGKIPGDGAACAWTLKGQDRDLTEAEVIKWEYTQGYYIIGVKSMASIKKFILKACEQAPSLCAEMDTVIEEETGDSRISDRDRVRFLEKKIKRIEKRTRF